VAVQTGCHAALRSAPPNTPKAFEIRAVHHGKLTDSAPNLSKLGHLIDPIPP